MDFKKVADDIVKKELSHYYVSPRPGTESFDLREAIAAALRSVAEEKVPDNHVMLPGGKVVKVLGSLPMTEDGFVAGIGAPLVLVTRGGEYLHAVTTAYMSIGIPGMMIHPELWHSTRESALDPAPDEAHDLLAPKPAPEVKP